MFARHALLSAALLAFASAVHAAADAAGNANTAPAGSPASLLVAIKLYPGVAQMQRVLSLPADAREAVFACLPAQIDAASLQASASPGVQVGQITLTRQPRAAVAEACNSPLDARIRELQTRISTLDAESAGIDLALNYLGSFGKAEHGAGNATGASIVATAASLRQQGQSATQDRLRVLRERDRLKAERDALLARRDRSTNSGDKSDSDDTAKVSTVRVTLAAPRQGGELRLTYQISGPSWHPGYRAELDTHAQQIKLTRLALVRQDSGEDWRDVALTLATGRPNADTQGSLPPPWQVDIRPPMLEKPQMARMAMAAPAPAPIAAAHKALAQASDEDAPPDFDVNETDAGYFTEFAVPQRVSVPSGNGQMALTLAAQTRQAALLARTAPGQQPAAYLIATVADTVAHASDSSGAAPAGSVSSSGVWPPGPVQLYRDGAYAGAGRFDAETLPRLGLAFGRDERVTVRVETPASTDGEGGFLNGRNVRRVTRAYVVENHHAEPITLQVVDAAPVAQNDKINVTSDYQPKPQTTQWLDQPGQVLWQQPLAAGASQRFTAQHAIAWPKDERLSE